jgi:hypothetical protein
LVEANEINVDTRWVKRLADSYAIRELAEVQTVPVPTYKGYATALYASALRKTTSTVR